MDFLLLKEIISNIGINNLDLYPRNRNLTRTIGDLSYQIVKSEGGVEGSGEHVERVLRFEFPNDPANPVIYIMLTGFYSSYEGTEWDSEITRVYPRIYTKLDFFKENDSVLDESLPNDPESII